MTLVKEVALDQMKEHLFRFIYTLFYVHRAIVIEHKTNCILFYLFILI